MLLGLLKSAITYFDIDANVRTVSVRFLVLGFSKSNITGMTSCVLKISRIRSNIAFLSGEKFPSIRTTFEVIALITLNKKLLLSREMKYAFPLRK